MVEKLDIKSLKKIRGAYSLLLFLIMPIIFSMLFYSKDSTNFFHYFNERVLFFKFLLIGCTFFICKIGLGNFLVNKSFSSLEKIWIIISLPLIEFLTLSSFSALKGVDILLLSETTTYFKISVFFIFYFFAIYIMLYLNYKTDNLDKEKKFDKIYAFFKHQHVSFKNLFWLKKAP